MANVNHTPGYFANSDLDWFCQINNVNIHVASMGRPISDTIMNTLPIVYEHVSEIDMEEWKGTEEIWFNERLLEDWLHIEDTQKIARFLYSFVVMARKGFYSFAPITVDPSDGDYYLMAKPVNYVHREIRGIVGKLEPNLNLENIDSFTAVRIGDLINSI